MFAPTATRDTIWGYSRPRLRLFHCTSSLLNRMLFYAIATSQCKFPVIMVIYKNQGRFGILGARYGRMLQISSIAFGKLFPLQPIQQAYFVVRMCCCFVIYFPAEGNPFFSKNNKKSLSLEYKRVRIFPSFFTMSF